MRFLFLVFSIFSIKASGQYLFQKVFDNPGFYTEVKNTIQCANGDYILACKSGGYGVLLRLDVQGNVIWSKKITGASGSCYVSSIVETDNNEFIAAGYEVRDTTFINLLRLNSTGDILWNKRYGLGNLNASHFIFNAYAHETPDGGYIVGGNDVAPDSNWASLVLIKCDSLGDTLWTRHITDGGILWDMHVLTNNGFILGTSIQTTLQIYGSVLRIDSLGNLLWKRDYPNRIFSGIAPLFDGSILVWGSKRELYRFDSLGNYLSGYRISADLYSTLQLADSTLLVSGSIYQNGKYDVLLMKFDKNLDTLWSQAYDFDSSGFATQLTQTNDSGFILSGAYQSVIYSRKLLVLKTDSLGISSCNHSATNVPIQTLNPIDTNIAYRISSGINIFNGSFSAQNYAIPEIAPCRLVAVEQLEKKDPPLLYPNPSSGIFYFKNHQSDAWVEVSDVTGKVLLFEKCNGLSLDLSNLGHGLYTAKFITNEAIVFRRLLIM